MVLAGVAGKARITAREIATELGITEQRSVRRIIADLEAGGYIKKKRTGRVSEYQVNPHMRLRHPRNQDIEVGKLLAVLLRRTGWRLPKSAPKNI